MTGSSCSSAAPQGSANPGLIAPETSRGGVTVWLIQVPRERPFSTDTCDHLTEHLLGRALFLQADKRALPFGLTVDGQTSIDKISIIVTHGGGAAGIRKVADILRDVSNSNASTRALPETVNTAEAGMVKAEEKGAAPPPPDLARLMREFPAQEGRCDAQDAHQQSRLLHRAAMMMVTEVAASEAAPILATLHAQPPEPFAPRLSLRSNAAPTDLYLAQAVRLDDVVAASAAAMSLEDFARNETERVGGAGLLVRFSQPVAPEQLTAKLSSLPAALLQQRAASVRSGICAKRASAASPVRAEAIRLANDAWAMAATTSTYCGQPSAPRSVQLPRFAAVEPGAGANREGLGRASRPIVLTACCATGVGAGGTAYYRDVLRRLLINELRFARSLAESADVTFGGQQARISVQNSLASREQLASVLRQMAADGSLPAKVTRAQRDMCVELPLASRKHNGDPDCARPASTNAVSHIALLLGAAQ
jgi:hypothetical protein